MAILEHTPTDWRAIVHELVTEVEPTRVTAEQIALALAKQPLEPGARGHALWLAQGIARGLYSARLSSAAHRAIRLMSRDGLVDLLVALCENVETMGDVPRWMNAQLGR